MRLDDKVMCVEHAGNALHKRMVPGLIRCNRKVHRHRDPARSAGDGGNRRIGVIRGLFRSCRNCDIAADRKPAVARVNQCAVIRFLFGNCDRRAYRNPAARSRNSPHNDVARHLCKHRKTRRIKVRLIDGGNARCAIERERYNAVYRNNAACDARAINAGSALHIALYTYSTRCNPSLFRRCCTALRSSLRRRADVSLRGEPVYRNRNRSAFRNRTAHDSDNRCVCVCFKRSGKVDVRRRCVYHNPLPYVGVHLSYVGRYGNACVYRTSAARNCTRGGNDVGFAAGLYVDVFAHIPQPCVSSNRGFHAAAEMRCAKGHIHRNCAAGNAACDRQHAAEVHAAFYIHVLCARDVSCEDRLYLREHEERRRADADAHEPTARGEGDEVQRGAFIHLTHTLLLEFRLHRALGYGAAFDFLVKRSKHIFGRTGACLHIYVAARTQDRTALHECLDVGEKR